MGFFCLTVDFKKKKKDSDMSDITLPDWVKVSKKDLIG